jgi:hypothetical protein
MASAAGHDVLVGPVSSDLLIVERLLFEIEQTESGGRQLFENELAKLRTRSGLKAANVSHLTICGGINDIRIGLKICEP